MGSLLQSCDEIVTGWLQSKSLPKSSEYVNAMRNMLAFVRMMRQDVKSNIPDRERTYFYPLSGRGYNKINLEPEISTVILVGTQLGRYVKALALNTHLATNGKVTNSMGLVSTDNNDLTWYNGALLGYGWGGFWTGTGQMGMAAWGNGQNYGDYIIDMEKKVLYTAPDYPYENVVIKAFTSCIEPSDETCIDWEFITAAEMYLDWRYAKARNANSQTQAKFDCFEEYNYQVKIRNRPQRASLVKVIERSWGYKSW